MIGAQRGDLLRRAWFRATCQQSLRWLGQPRTAVPLRTRRVVLTVLNATGRTSAGIAAYVDVPVTHQIALAHVAALAPQRPPPADYSRENPSFRPARVSEFLG